MPRRFADGAERMTEGSEGFKVQVSGKAVVAQAARLRMCLFKSCEKLHAV
jgi:ribosomal protein S3